MNYRQIDRLVYIHGMGSILQEGLHVMLAIQEAVVYFYIAVVIRFSGGFQSLHGGSCGASCMQQWTI